MRTISREDMIREDYENQQSQDDGWDDDWDDDEDDEYYATPMKTNGIRWRLLRNEDWAEIVMNEKKPTITWLERTGLIEKEMKYVE